MASPLRLRHRTFGPFGAIFVLVGVATLAACGGTDVPPTANDPATVAAARTATANVAPTAGGSGTAATTGNTTASIGGRSFGSLLTPVAQGTVAPARGTTTTGGASTRGAGMAGAGGTAQGNALDPCGLVPVSDLTRALGETVRQAAVESEKPVTTPAVLAGYSNASCAFTATGSMQGNERGVILETIRPTPSRMAMAMLPFGDLWSAVSQEVQQDGINTSPVNGVGDEAIAFEDPDGSGDTRIYVRKGSTLLQVIVVGYAADGRTKAIAVAKQAVTKL